ncbi:DUF2399 domain-containing protein [Streptomyces syringium]|uniref:DUF2399 domain-containing protein n=1 Tax=Streptomyces syringium TaxID=76729 RepID=UPI00343146E3
MRCGIQVGWTRGRDGRRRPWPGPRTRRPTCENPTALAAAAPSLPPLTGTPAEAPWDPALAPALADLGVRAEEETILDLLLGDLA